MWRGFIESFPELCDDYRGKSDAEVLQKVKDDYAAEDPSAHVQEADEASLQRLGKIYREECE